MKKYFKSLSFSNLLIDGLHSERKNVDVLSRYYDDKQSKCLVFNKNSPSKNISHLNFDVLMSDNKLKFANLSDLSERKDAVFLGLYENTPLFSAVIDNYNKKSNEDFENLRKLMPQLSQEESSIVGYAKSLLHYHHNTQFCGCCGSKTVMKEGGIMRKCTNQDCNFEVYPRIDPCIICLVRSKCGTKALLAKHHRSKQNNIYTCLAGFMQLETIEETVKREVFEEVSVKVDNIQYVGSQPWPFPNSLMIGCIADSVEDSPDIKLDDSEIIDARYFGREEILSMIEGKHPQGYTAPMPYSLSHTLIQMFLNNIRVNNY